MQSADEIDIEPPSLILSSESKKTQNDKKNQLKIELPLWFGANFFDYRP